MAKKRRGLNPTSVAVVVVTVAALFLVPAWVVLVAYNWLFAGLYLILAAGAFPFDRAVSDRCPHHFYLILAIIAVASLNTAVILLFQRV